MAASTTKKRGAKKTVTLGPQKKGQKAVTFQKGGLHRSTSTPMGEKIPASKMAAAKAGDYGPKAKKQAIFATGMLAAGRQTASRGQKKAATKRKPATKKPTRQ